MQLGDNHPLDPVDDKGSVAGHERDFTHVDFLLLDILDGLVVGILVVDDKSDLDPERNRVRHAAELTLLNIENRFAQSVAHVFKRSIARVADNRKHGLECRVQSLLNPLSRIDLVLHELLIGFHLDG